MNLIQLCTFTKGCNKPAIYEMQQPSPDGKTHKTHYVCADCDERLGAHLTKTGHKIAEEISKTS
jgi:hypothetical protein